MKKLILSLFLIASPVFGAKLDYYDFSKGMMDMVSPERIPNGYTPYCLNTYLDSDMGAVMRNGYAKFNTTALTGSQSTRGAYTYKKSDGTNYLLVASSNSIFSSSVNGSFTAIKSGLSSAARPTFATYLEKAWGGDGVDNEFSFDGNTYTEYTVSNSTNMVKAKYHCLFGNRMNRAGVTGSLSTLYYSELGDPANLGNGTNWDYFSQDDGDVITWICPSPDGSFLMVFKNYSTWGRYGTNPKTWTIKCLNPSVGCLYGTTVANLDGALVFQSADGICQFDGSEFKIISEPIRNQIGDLWQNSPGTTGLTIDSASDWGSGTGTNIDTTTYSGSVALLSSATAITQSLNNVSYGAAFRSYKMRQRIVNTTAKTVNRVELKFAPSGASSQLKVEFQNSSYTALVSSVIVVEGSNPFGTYDFNVDLGSINLAANSTYYIQITSISVPVSGAPSIKAGTASPAYEYILYDDPIPTNWQYDASGYALYYVLYSTTAGSYTSGVKQATNWTSWGTFSVDDSRPTGSAISYYVKTSTATNDFSMRPIISVTNGALINSTTGPYIITIASFTRPSLSVVPLLNKVDIDWTSPYGQNPPLGIVYDDSYNYFCSTDANTGINNVRYRYNRNRAWELHNDIYANSATMYRGRLITGCSDSKGLLYTMDVPNLYTDDGRTYTASLETLISDCGDPFSEKDFKEIWVSAKSNPGTLNLSYRLDGSEGDYTSIPFSTDIGDSIVAQKLPLPYITKSRYIQLKVDSDSYFNLRGMSLFFDVLPLQ